MIGFFRKFLGTRIARLFFVVLIIPFVMWGVADVARNIGQDSALATVGDRKVEPPEFQEAFRRQLAQVGRMLGGKVEPTPAMRRGVAAQTLDGLIVQSAIAGEVQRLGIAVPDEALRQAVFAMPVFRGRTGAFDRATFESVLRQNNLTEGRFLEGMRTDLAQKQLMESVQAGSAAPDVLVNQVFAFQHETRVAEVVELPFSAAPDPGMPTADDLQRAYADDPGRYSAPAFRRIKAVVLSPDTVARGMEVPDADVAAYYAAHKGEFGSPEKRAVQVLIAQDQAQAQALATQWSGGADWTAMQAAAGAAGASAAAVDETSLADMPGGELGEAAFKAAPETVVGPVKSAFGWQVLRVTRVVPSTERPLEAVREEVALKVARERAVDEVYTRSSKLEDALSAGTSLDNLPGDLGLAAITGTLDAKGNTPEGEPAPIPGSPAVRQAIVTAAFAAGRNDPPRLIEGPEQAYFALAIEDETPPTVKPFAAVEDQVRENWVRDARRKSQEAVAAKLLAAVKAGGSLEDAATVAGLRAERTPPMARGAPTPGVSPQLVEPMFALKANEATMVEAGEGFIVTRLLSATAPEPGSDPVGALQMRTALNQQLSQDIELTYATALRDRAKPTVNRALLESLSQ